MRLGALWVAAVLMTGCASGSPMGFRVASAGIRYRPSTPASMPRDVPSPDDEDDAPARPAVASASQGSKGVRGPVKLASGAKKKAPAVAKRSEPSRPALGEREAVLGAARALLGQMRVMVNGRQFPSDCIGLVEGAYSMAGLSWRQSAQKGDNGVTALYRYAQAHGRVYTGGRPVPGDIVFFRETYDQNRDGRRNDGLTHVALVDSVDEDGTVTVIHRVRSGVVRYRMNLARKDSPRDPKTGEVINDMLRPPGPGRKQVLTGQLFAAYASLLPPPAPTAVARR